MCPCHLADLQRAAVLCNSDDISSTLCHLVGKQGPDPHHHLDVVICSRLLLLLLLLLLWD
jgi:hypothetical protein